MKIRDMNRTAFNKELAIYKFSQTAKLGWFEDTSGKTNAMYRGVIRDGKLLRKQTIIWLIQAREGLVNADQLPAPSK